jgi:hypothetical protein
LVQDGFIGRDLGLTALAGAEMLSNRINYFRLQSVQKIVRQQLLTVVTREWSSHYYILM